MRPLPPGLPGPNSPKWHSRRAWDGLGYLRVRTLSNPDWQRDLPWLIRLLRLETPASNHPLRHLYDDAVDAAIRYPRTLAGTRDSDASWDEFLGCVDAILVARQQAHLDRIRQAGVSGDQVPPRPGGD